MPRAFDGTDDKVTLTASAWRAWTGVSGFALWYHATTSSASGLARFPYWSGGNDLNVAADSHVGLGTVAASGGGVPDNTLIAGINGTQFIATTAGITAQTNQWVITGFTKATGTSVCRFHSYGFTAGGAFSRGNTSGSTGDPVTTAQTNEYIGAAGLSTAFSTFHNDAIQMVAVWDRALSDQEVDSLAASYEAWMSPGLQRFFRLDQAATTTNVIDWVGSGANQSGLTGTTISTRSTPTIGYGGSPIKVQAIPSAVSVTATPGALAHTFVFPGATVTGTSLATPSTLAHTFSFPAPTIQAGAVPTPGALAHTFVFPGATVTGTALVTPGALAHTFTFPAPTVETGAPVTVEPAALAHTFVFPAPTITGTSLATPGALAHTFTFPGASIAAGATATPSTLAHTFTFPAATVTGGATATPGALAHTFTFPAPTVSGAALVTPGTLAHTFTFPAPTISTDGNVTVQAQTLAHTFAFGAPTVTATGGGGGPVDDSPGIHVPFRVIRRRRRKR